MGSDNESLRRGVVDDRFPLRARGYDFKAEFPDLARLTEQARKVARRNAKVFPLGLRYAYFCGFVEGCTGVAPAVEFVGRNASVENVAYVCGGIDGSAWA